MNSCLFTLWDGRTNSGVSQWNRVLISIQICWINICTVVQLEPIHPLKDSASQIATSSRKRLEGENTEEKKSHAYSGGYSKQKENNY